MKREVSLPLRSHDIQYNNSVPLSECGLLFQVTEPTSEVPDNIRPNHLIKELTKEIRYLEVREVKDHKKLLLSNQV